MAYDEAVMVQSPIVTYWDKAVEALSTPLTIGHDDAPLQAIALYTRANLSLQTNSDSK